MKNFEDWIENYFLQFCQKLFGNFAIKSIWNSLWVLKINILPLRNRSLCCEGTIGQELVIKRVLSRSTYPSCIWIIYYNLLEQGQILANNNSFSYRGWIKIGVASLSFAYSDCYLDFGLADVYPLSLDS